TDAAVLHELFGVADLDAIESSVTDVRHAPDGRYVVVLANGQVWMQADDATLRPAVGDAAKIRHAMMGSFMLTIAQSKKSMRVRPIDSARDPARILLY